MRCQILSKNTPVAFPSTKIMPSRPVVPNHRSADRYRSVGHLVPGRRTEIIHISIFWNMRVFCEPGNPMGLMQSIAAAIHCGGFPHSFKNLATRQDCCSSVAAALPSPCRVRGERNTLHGNVSVINSFEMWLFANFRSKANLKQRHIWPSNTLSYLFRNNIISYNIVIYYLTPPPPPRGICRSVKILSCLKPGRGTKKVGDRCCTGFWTGFPTLSLNAF